MGRSSNGWKCGHQFTVVAGEVVVKCVGRVGGASGRACVGPPETQEIGQGRSRSYSGKWTNGGAGVRATETGIGDGGFREWRGGVEGEGDERTTGNGSGVGVRGELGALCSPSSRPNPQQVPAHAPTPHPHPPPTPPCPMPDAPLLLDPTPNNPLSKQCFSGFPPTPRRSNTRAFHTPLIHALAPGTAGP